MGVALRDRSHGLSLVSWLGEHRHALRVLFVTLAVLVGVERVARADLREAPIGGRSFPVGDGRIGCAPAPAGWTIEAGGRHVKPPAAATAIGAIATLKIAPNVAACEGSGETVRLAATGTWPQVDASAFVLALDEGRLEGRGRAMKGAAVAWRVEQGYAADTCREPKPGGGNEGCAWAVPRSLSADPAKASLHWLPEGGYLTADAVFFDSEGRRVPLESFAITPLRVEVTQLVPADASVDVSAGVGLIPLVHPDAVVRVDCGGVTCELAAGMVRMQVPPPGVSNVDVKFRLATHVYFTKKAPPETQPTIRIAILRCPMEIVSGPVLRGVDSARTVARIGGGCTRDSSTLHFIVGTRRVETLQVQTTPDAVYAVLPVGNVDASTLSITAIRGETEATVVAVARIDTRPAPQVRSSLEVATYRNIEFIPNNRPATVHTTRVPGAELALLSIAGVYTASFESGTTTVQGDPGAAGQTSLQFGYRWPTLPAPLDKTDLGVLVDVLQRPIREANIPAPFGLSAMTDKPLIEVVCTDKDGRVLQVRPGTTPHLEFSLRDNCRVVIHRERLSAEFGTQKVLLEIDVNKLDGSARPAAHVGQTIILRAGAEPRVAWIKGVMAPYDRVVVKLTHVADEAHYLGAQEIVSGAPAVQWTVVLGNGRLRIYATSTIPTGLYRFGDKNATSGVLSLSFGVISRLTWLDDDGHEGLLGLETGVVAFGLTGDSTPSGQTLTHVGAIAGLGISIPIVNAGAPTQASINVHGWFEQSITGGTGSPRSFIFGPSISLGNVGATF